MRMNLRIRIITFLGTCILFLNACNFPQPGLALTATASYTATASPEPTQVHSATPVESPIPTATLSEIPILPTITSTSTAFLLPTPTYTPVFTFTPAPPARIVTTGVEGLVSIVKPSRTLPLGGAAITLYRDQTKDDLISTITIMDGSYRFTQIPSGKYYLVVVWVLSKPGAWPCANEKLPPAGKRNTWKYEANGLPIYVEIYAKTAEQIIVAMSTGSFSVSGTRKNVNMPLICNQLK